jgi:hypothetical protein
MTTSPHLVALPGHTLETFASPHGIDTAASVATRADRALAWLNARLGPGPRPPLFVVGPEDWPSVALIPIYGMPHAFPDRVVVGTSPAAFWDEYFTAIRLIDRGGEISEEISDLLIAHELTHLYHSYDTASGSTDFAHLWLAELFANVGLYGYVSDVEPDALPALDAIADASLIAGRGQWQVTGLRDMEASLAAGPLNYCWFEFLLIRVARALWRADPMNALQRFHETLRGPLSEEQVIARLAAISPIAAELVRSFPEAPVTGPLSGALSVE